MSYEIEILSDDNLVRRESLSHANVVCFYQWKIVFVREYGKTTWELPGWTRDEWESIWECAKRELYEETGIENVALKFQFNYKLFDTIKEKSYYGSVFKTSTSTLPLLLPESEIEEIQAFETIPDNLTYPFQKEIIESIY